MSTSEHAHSAAGARDTLWRWAGFDEGAVKAWTQFAAWVGQQRDETVADVLAWAQTWSVHDFSLDDAVEWCRLPHPLEVLPTLAAVARRCDVPVWLIARWRSVLGEVPVTHVPLLSELARCGWSGAAVDLLGTASTSDVPTDDLLLRLLGLPPSSVLDGARAGLDLKAAVELAEFRASGASTDALLARLIAARAMTPETGARINVAITDIGDDVAPGMWQTRCEVDARVISSVRQSLPADAWDRFLANDFSRPAAPDVLDATGGLLDTWRRRDDEWTLIDPPEDRAVQPAMAWTSDHQLDALRRCLDEFLPSLEADDSVEMSWPPEGYLTHEGSWGHSEPEECYQHGNTWDDACEECVEVREASLVGDSIVIYSHATWSWSVEVTTYRYSGESESSDGQWWRVTETSVDPREVRYH